MSKRFGRNQKRRMRDEIALQSMLRRQAQAALEGESAGRLKEKRLRMQIEIEMLEWAARIVGLLGEKSAFARDIHEELVDPGLFESVAIEGRPYRAALFERFRVRSSFTPDSAAKFIDLFATYATPERDDIGSRCRFLIRSQDGAAALVTDERTIHTLRAINDQALIDYLVRHLISPWVSGALR